MKRSVSRSLIAVIVLATMGSGFFLLRLRNFNTSGAFIQEFSGPILPGPSPVPIQGQNVPLEMARLLAGFEIRTPSYLALSTDVKLESVRLASLGGKSMVTLIYSKAQLEGDVYINQIVGSGGMVIIESPDSRDPTTTINMIVNETKGSVKAITVNGYPGMGTGVVADKYIHGQISYWANGVHYNIIADLSLEELIKVAQSM